MKAKLLSLLSMVALCGGMNAQELAGGDYLIQNVESGRYLNGGNNWGTKASATFHGQFMTIASVGEGVYTIDSHYSNGGDKHFLAAGDNTYVDATPANHTIEAVAEGVYTIKDANGKYLAAADGLVNFNADEVTDAAKWKFITKEDVLASLAEASVENPIDITALVPDANFSRNNQDINLWEGASKMGKGGPNDALGATATGMNAEKWGGNSKSIDFHTTIAGLPNGKYQIKFQGLYRYNNTADNTNDVAAAAHADGTEVIISKFSANNDTIPFMSVADSAAVATYGKMPFSQAEASQAFTLGCYQHDFETIVEDSTLTLAVTKNEADHIGTDWTILDNIEVYYLGQLPELHPEAVPALMDGEEEIALNSHIIVSADKATALSVNFIDMPTVSSASYVINEMTAEVTEEGTTWTAGEEVAKGDLSINVIGYAEFENTIDFKDGKKYQVTITAFENPAEPTECGKFSFEFNGYDIPVPEIANGEYYIKNVEAGKFLSNGAAWGTRSVLSDNGICYGVTKGEDGKYTLISGIKGATKALRPSDGFNDQSGAWELIIEDDVVYMFNGEKYFCNDASNVPQFTEEKSEAAKWQFLTKEDLMKDFDNASTKNPVDATFLITGADFHNADVKNAAWSTSKVGGNYAQGCTLINSSNCEQWKGGAVDINQTITVPNGVYTLSVFGYTRQDGLAATSADAFEADTLTPGYLYANDKQVVLSSIFANYRDEKTDGFSGNCISTAGKSYWIPNSQSDAAVCFEQGLYLNTLNVTVSDSTLKLGVKVDNIEWIVIDNFRLSYLGEEGKIAPITAEDVIFSIAEDSVIDLAETKTINVNVAVPAGIDAKTDLFISGTLIGRDGTNMVINGTTDFEDGVDVNLSTLNPGNMYMLEINKIAFGEVTGMTENYEPIYEYEFAGTEYEALATLMFSTKEGAKADILETLGQPEIAMDEKTLTITFAGEGIAAIDGASMESAGIFVTNSEGTYYANANGAEAVDGKITLSVNVASLMNMLTFDAFNYVAEQELTIKIQEPEIYSSADFFNALIKGDDIEVKYTTPAAPAPEIAVTDLDGKAFVITDLDGTSTLTACHTVHPAGEQDAFALNLSEYTGEQYILAKFAKVTDATVEGENLYTIQMTNENGDFYSLWGANGYLNFQPAGQNIVFVLGLTDKYGQDALNCGLWSVTEVEGKGLLIKNVGNGGYYDPMAAVPSAEPVYVKLQTKEECPATAIESVSEVAKANGKYMENGKIVIVKNGMKFNINGAAVK